MTRPFWSLLEIWLRHVCVAFLLIAGLVGGAGLAVAADEFCPVPPAPITIHNKVPVIKDSNIKDFAATNSLTRYGTIVELGDLGVEIARAAGSLGEVQSFLTFLSDFYDYMLAASDRGVGEALSKQVVAALEAFHFLRQIPERRVHIMGADSNDAGSYVFVMYGSYSYAVDGDIILNMILRNTMTGEQRTYTAKASVNNVARAVASKIFDEFYLPKPPKFVNPLEGRKFLVTQSALEGRLTEVNIAEQICQTQGARLPTRLEIELAAALGKYITGLVVDRKSFYTVIDAEKGLSVFRPGTGECYGFKPGSPDEGLLVCVR